MFCGKCQVSNALRCSNFCFDLSAMPLCATFVVFEVAFGAVLGHTLTMNNASVATGPSVASFPAASTTIAAVHRCEKRSVEAADVAESDRILFRGSLRRGLRSAVSQHKKKRSTASSVLPSPGERLFVKTNCILLRAERLTRIAVVPQIVFRLLCTFPFLPTSTFLRKLSVQDGFSLRLECCMMHWSMLLCPGAPPTTTSTCNVPLCLLRLTFATPFSPILLSPVSFLVSLSPCVPCFPVIFSLSFPVSPFSISFTVFRFCFRFLFPFSSCPLFLLGSCSSVLLALSVSPVFLGFPFSLFTCSLCSFMLPFFTFYLSPFSMLSSSPFPVPHSCSDSHFHCCPVPLPYSLAVVSFSRFLFFLFVFSFPFTVF